MVVRWEVVGGIGRGGILVRKGQELSSPQLSERLSTSAIVQELRREGDRLSYKLLSGTGPAQGWVSVTLSGKVLLERKGDSVPVAAPEDEAPDVEVQILTLGAGVVAELKLPRSATAADVQEELSKVLGVPAGEQHLLVGTTELKGARRLCEVAEGGQSSPLQITLVQTKRVGLAALSGSRSGAMQLWDLERGRALRDFEGHGGAVTCVSLHLASKRAVSGSEDGRLRLWDIGSSEPLLELNAHEGGVTCLVADWASMRVLSGGQDSALRLWDLEYREVLSELLGHRGPVTSVFWDSALGCAVSGSRDCCLRLWRVDAGEAFRELQGHMAPVNCVTANFPRQIAISGSIAIVRVWFNIANRHSHEYYSDWEGHTGWVISVAADWSREVTMSVDQEGTMRFFGPEGTRVLRNPDVNRRMTCATPLWASNRFLRGFDDGLLHLWAEDGTVDKELDGHASGALCLALDGAAAPATTPGEAAAGEGGEAAPPPPAPAQGVAEVLLSMPADATRRNIFQVQFPGSLLDGGSTRPTVGQLRKQIAEHHQVPYLQRLRFHRPGRKEPLADGERVPVPPMELEVAGPGSVVQALTLAMQGTSGGPEQAAEG